MTQRDSSSETTPHRMEAERQADLAWKNAVERAQRDAATVERAQRRARKAREILDAR